MPSPHRIRLRGQWRFEALAFTVRTASGESRIEDRDLPPPGTVSMPSDWGPALGADFRGRVRFTRSFHRPTGLEPDDRVDLVFDLVDAFGQAELNGKRLGSLLFAQCPTRFDITAALKPYNELVVEVEAPRIVSDSAPLFRGEREELPGGIIGEVRLEIFASEE